MGNKRNYKTGIFTYRDIAFRNREHKCERCGYDECEHILIVHHKDRIRINNEPENLEILCPNCHSFDHFNQQDGMHHLSEYNRQNNKYRGVISVVE